ncbi:HDOD domain-containing protein [Lacimicrobium sp. SS2-24]|uniref:HDOD domain-containing protein n=1 Tax=Lacimicrobium sp. SS2-24 TaxID=2005569 RepID=UPI000B4AE2AD|nr:HDOD domain-containing protein [Lacimicrobium sp. SS2-24]
MSQPLSKGVQNQLEGLAELEKRLQQSGNVNDILSHCLSLSRRLVDDYNLEPAAWQSLTQLYFPSYSRTLNHRFRRMLLALNLCQFHRWHTQSRYGMVCAAMTLDLYSWPTITETFLSQLKRLDHRIWSSSLIPVARLLPLQKKAGFYRRFTRLTHPQLLLMTVALLTNPSSSASREEKWLSALRKLARALPTACYDLLTPIISQAGLIPPGSLIRFADDKTAIILSRTDTSWLIRYYDPHCQHFDDDITLISASPNCKVLAPLKVKELSVINTLWDVHWQAAFQQQSGAPSLQSSSQPLSKPPAKLLAIQDLLQRQDPDIDKICEHIAAEGFLARQLKTTASHRTRMKLQMEEVKHALLFQGFERTNSVLVQQALLSRLNQFYFPLQQHILQFCILFGHVVEALAERQSKLTTETVVTLGYFFCSGLFISLPLKRRTSLPRRGTPHYSLETLFVLATDTSSLKHSLTLTRAWQQPTSSVDAIRCHHQLPDDMRLNTLTKLQASLLGLALMMTRQIYFGDSLASDADRQYQQQALTVLNLQSADQHNIIESVLENSQCYWPVD